MPYTITIDMPDSTNNADVNWRMAEYVRVLNASCVLENALAKNTYPGFRYVNEEFFYLDAPGPKFTRVVRLTFGQRHVHCFIENSTGKVIKAAGWKSPAKDKAGLAYRYDLMDDNSRALLYSRGTRVYFYRED